MIELIFGLIYVAGYIAVAIVGISGGLIVGAFEAAYYAIEAFFRIVFYADSKVFAPKKKYKYPQPCKINYFFGPGYSKFKRSIGDVWGIFAERAGDHTDGIDDATLDGGIVAATKISYHIGVIILMYVLGISLIIALFVIYGIIFFTMAVSSYLLFSLIWLVDRLYLKTNRIFTTCTKCHSSSSYLLPTYLCPNCGTEHTRLVPSRYGFFYHRCSGNGGTCNYKIPCTFFSKSKKQRRKDMEAICPNPRCKNKLYSKETTPICIPIIGAASVGKTMYITAFINELINNIAPSNNWLVLPYSIEKEVLLNEVKKDYLKGDVNKTSDHNSLSYNFFLRSNLKKWSPDRLFYIYDIAGEVFGGEEEHQMQRQYEYCHGIIFIIDPYASNEVYMKYGVNITGKDKVRISQTDQNEALDSFINKLKEITGKSSKEIANVPIAVLINKVDIGNINEHFNDNTVHDHLNKTQGESTNFIDAQSYICKEFLLSNGMANIVKTIETKFKTNHFFYGSALGHSVNVEREFNPQKVTEPLKWLLSFADKKIYNTWRS